MHPAHVLAIQVPWNLCVYSLFVIWWIAPRLSKRPIHEALVPPIALHLIRPISFWTTVGGERIPGMRIPMEWALSTAVGDLVAAVLALFAIFMLRAKARGSIAAAWVFKVVGFVDAAKNGVYAARLGMAGDVGAAGILMAYAVPALFVTHALIFWLLARQARGGTRAVPV